CALPISLLPLLDGHRVTDVVLPHAVELEVALGDALVAEPQLLDHPPAPVVAGDDRHLDAVEVDLLEREPGRQDERLGHVALAGVAPVDPVADVGRLERSPVHRRQVDLAAEPLPGAPQGSRLADEDAEAVAGAELPLP